MESNEALLEKVKFALRIDETDHDDELQDLIAAAKREIVEVGVSPAKVTDTDELIIRACIVYCKANFGYDDEKERFAMAFEKMLVKLSLLGAYKEAPDEGT